MKWFYDEMIVIQYLFKQLKLYCFLMCTTLSGCFTLPTATTYFSSSAMVESTIVTGASYAGTGKGVSDHVLSGYTKQDCELFNIFKFEPICKDHLPDKIPIRDLNQD